VRSRFTSADVCDVAREFKEIKESIEGLWPFEVKNKGTVSIF